MVTLPIFRRMIPHRLLALAVVIKIGAAVFTAQAVEGVNSAPASFNEPVIPGFHADPSICHVGDDFYLVNSSFEYFPGVPIFHSRDLVHWQQLGHALTRKSQLNLDHMRASGGIFAPTLRYHDGTFYLITTLVWGGGNFYVTSTNAAGPWSDPVWLDKDGIDPSLFFDDNGKVYYTRQVGGEHGFSGQQLLNVQTGKLEGDIKELWRGTGGVWPEGPHLYKINGKYYLMISEGGTSYDHSLTIARSDSPWGPFEADPRNPILTHRNLPENPFQAMGHGDLVETPDGWWVVFLGFRPQGGRFHHLGRETFLAPVTWENGWPLINDGQPIAARVKAPKLPPHPLPDEPLRDEFDKASLRPCWTFIRNPETQNYSLTERPGWLRLKGSAVSLNDVATPTFVGRCQTDFNCRMATKISFEPQQTNEEAGLVLRGNDRNHVEIVVTRRDGKRSVGLRKVLDGQVVEPLTYHEVPAGELVLSIQATPLIYEFFWAGTDGLEHRLGTVRTRDLSSETLTAQKGAAFNFTGVFMGMFALGNGRANMTPADFDWFEYHGQDVVLSGSRPSVSDTREQIATASNLDHQRMMDLLHITSLRRGRDGSDTNSRFYANYDEARANPFPILPDPLVLKNGEKVTTPEKWWQQRRPEIIEDFSREIYGRVPANVPKVKWEVTKTTKETNGVIPVITKQLVGHVDNSSYPRITVDIQLTLTTPAEVAGPVPVMINFGFGNFPGFGGTNGFNGTNRFAGTNGLRGLARPNWQQLVLSKGWGYAVLVPTSYQADNGAGLTLGIIGLCNQGRSRKPEDWGALRAWAWGASRALDYLETDKDVDAKQVGIEGLSRYGKAALVTMAYDQRFAIALVGSSGEGGAKLHRRNWGEQVENLTSSGEYHWMAGNFLKYGGPLTPGDLPVDAHELIALCAPRPTFISYGASSGTPGAEGGWVDQRGSFMASVAAGPVFKLLGKRDLGTPGNYLTDPLPPVNTALLDGELAWRQHDGGHTDGPNWPAFLNFAGRYFNSPSAR